jgi:hypothetical protein
MRWNYQNIACNFYFQLERGPRPFRSTGVHPGFSAVRVARSLFFCVVCMFCISLFVLFLFHLAIVSSVLLRFNDYEHYVTPLFGIFKLLTLYKMGTIWEKKSYPMWNVWWDPKIFYLGGGIFFIKWSDIFKFKMFIG